jgi:hypothetical protein
MRIIFGRSGRIGSGGEQPTSRRRLAERRTEKLLQAASYVVRELKVSLLILKTIHGHDFDSLSDDETMPKPL